MLRVILERLLESLWGVFFYYFLKKDLVSDVDTEHKGEMYIWKDFLSIFDPCAKINPAFPD